MAQVMYWFIFGTVNRGTGADTFHKNMIGMMHIFSIVLLINVLEISQQNAFNQ